MTGGEAQSAAAIRHGPYEDALALLIGAALVALGLHIYATASLATGGVAGLSLLVQYATGAPFAPVFFLVNLPFYALAVSRLGWGYTLRTFAAVALVSVLARMVPDWLAIGRIDPVFAALIGGVLIGNGLLVLFRHRAGLGGFNILAVFLQETRDLRAGYVQLALDACVLAAALFLLPFAQVLLSLVGAIALNMILAINHRPGRYTGMS